MPRRAALPRPSRRPSRGGSWPPPPSNAPGRSRRPAAWNPTGRARPGGSEGAGMNTEPEPNHRLSRLLCLGLLLGTFAVFGQVLRHEFINYDDADYVTENPRVQDGVTPQAL